MQSDQVKSISKEHLKRMLDAGESYILLDVRSKEDYEKDHIKGAQSMPLDELDEKAPKAFKKDARIVVYCDSYVCSASTSAYKFLTRMGYSDVRDYKGGVREWKASGFPTESSPS